jgi:hypothetical protein
MNKSMGGILAGFSVVGERYITSGDDRFANATITKNPAG